MKRYIYKVKAMEHAPGFSVVVQANNPYDAMHQAAALGKKFGCVLWGPVSPSFTQGFKDWGCSKFTLLFLIAAIGGLFFLKSAKFCF